MDARDAPEVTRKTEPAGLSARIWHLLAALAASLMLVSVAPSPAQAKRPPGGHEAAKPSSTTTARDAAGVAQATPAVVPAILPSAPAMSGTGMGGAVSSTASGSRWLAPMAGLAAGLGVATLAGGAGFDGALVLVALLTLLAAVVLLPLMFWLLARRSSGRRQVLQPPLVYAGIGQEAMVPQQYLLPEPASGNRHEVPVVRPAAGCARPVETGGQRIPADFDASGFVREARVRYLRLQAAHDAGDLDRLREFTSADLFARIQAELAANGPSGATEFPVLDVQLLGVSSNSSEQTASVRFRGCSRAAGAGEAELFDEVWSLTRPLDVGHGWVLAGIQPLR